MNNPFEKSIVLEGKELFIGIRNEKESLFDKQYWLGRMMEWVMKDPKFKVDLFRFVDVLPVLSDKDQVAKHIEEYLLHKDREIPLLMGTALKAASFSFARGMAAAAIRKNVSDMAQKFILGDNLSSAEKALLKLEKQGFCFTIDLLGEKTLSYQEADGYFQRYCDLINNLPSLLKQSPSNPPNISIKVSALSPNLREEDPRYSIDEAKKRVLPILRLAKQQNVFINFDLESYQSHEIISQLFNEIILSEEFIDWPHLGIVVQAYLKESLMHLRALIENAKKRGTPISIRLVKGAYWDYEVVKAEQLGHECPVFLDKALTDQNYERLSKLLLDEIDFVRPCFGSHNIRSLAHAIAYAKQKNIDPGRYEIQMLYGMAESERKVLLNRGHNLRIYVPLGDMLPGMSYLVRRLLENTSQMSFVKKSHHDQESEDKLLEAPMPNLNISAQPKAPFVNESLLDFTSVEVRTCFQDALEKIRLQLPINVPVVIGNQEQKNLDTMPRKCPSETSLIVSQVKLGSIQQAEAAIEICLSSELDLVSVENRANHLEDLAKILREDRYIFAALIVYEVGKTWAEADADVAEAIDFCRYYALAARSELAPPPLGQVSGEENVMYYQARGSTIIIAPWNFPLAILCGMSVAAYVAGNPIILKPAEQSSATAYFLYQRMIRAGFSATSVHFLPGRGEIVGRHLVSHPAIANICFTGSMAVGHEISRAANTVVDRQKQMKKVIVEMGGKNAIIIDDDADLDEAVSAVLKSAFVYAGQKCSAASRIILVGSIAEPFIERLQAAASSFKIGSAIDPSTFMGPVIDVEAFSRLQEKIALLKQDNSLKTIHLGEEVPGGYFVPPAIFLVKDENHWLMQEELFGPILALYAAADLAHALRVANNSKYALTGAIFSRSPVNIAKTKELFRVGNLYINQKCTGAMVNRQPFGGFKMSGTGLKAGGPHYLLNFVDAKAISENTMRRGFAPEVSA